MPPEKPILTEKSLLYVCREELPNPNQDGIYSLDGGHNDPVTTTGRATRD